MTGRKQALIADLNRAARDASGLGVLLGEAAARRLAIHPTDFECLGLVGEGDGATAGALAAASGLTTGAITALIDRLERAGLAVRVRDSRDRRRVIVRMTPRARRWAARYSATFGAAIDALAAGYSEAEIALIAGYFRRSADVIRRQIEALGDR
jgi:DNA-binding MarR family transcriptional regulator